MHFSYVLPKSQIFILFVIFSLVIKKLKKLSKKFYMHFCYVLLVGQKHFFFGGGSNPNPGMPVFFLVVLV